MSVLVRFEAQPRTAPPLRLSEPVEVSMLAVPRVGDGVQLDERTHTVAAVVWLPRALRPFGSEQPPDVVVYLR